jgi:3'(2'), 5'-bisphosphate nucleotidase
LALCHALAVGYQPRMNDSALVSLAADLARRAGAAIMAVRVRGFDVNRKSDASPVTEADHAAEAIIVEGLRRALPDVPVIAEEEVAAGRVPPASAARECWLVDPLDGTKEFAAGHDEFTVNIGLIRDGRCVLGVVASPGTGELFGGVVGRGAWKRTTAGERAIAARAPSPDGLVVMASRSHVSDSRLAAYLEGRKVAAITNMGSSLKLCRLAEGVADLYPRLGRTMEWDTAAAQAVLEAAGGHVRTLDGAPLTYGKPNWENPHFVCSGKLAA